MQIFLVRHGQSTCDIENRAEGSFDAPLTALGEEQARRLARGFALKGVRFDVLLTSPLQRATKTASILADSMACPVVSVEHLRELDIGAWAGMLRSELERLYPLDKSRGPAPFYRGFREPIPGGGESFADLLRRAHAFACELVARPEVTIGVVSHGKFLQALLATMFHGLSEPLDRYPTALVATGDTGWHEIKYAEGIWYLRRTNVTDHLMPSTQLPSS